MRRVWIPATIAVAAAVVAAYAVWLEAVNQALEHAFRTQ